MSKKTVIAKARVSENTKKQADLILESHDTNMSSLIRATLENIVENNALPYFMQAACSPEKRSEKEFPKEKMTVLEQVQGFLLNTFNLELPSVGEARSKLVAKLVREYQDNAIPMIVCSEEIERISVELRKWKDEQAENKKNGVSKNVNEPRKERILSYIDRVIELSEQMDSYRENVKYIQHKLDETELKNK